MQKNPYKWERDTTVLNSLFNTKPASNSTFDLNRSNIVLVNITNNFNVHLSGLIFKDRTFNKAVTMGLKTSVHKQ